MAEDSLSPFDPINGTPVTIVFGSFNYRDIVAQWIEHAQSACDHWRIVCLDKDLVAWLNEMGHNTRAVYFYDLFPDMNQSSLINPRNKSVKKTIIFRVLRPKLWRALADSGRDFIHSDADAFWLQDPRPWLMQHTEFDLLISQGTTKPLAQFYQHRFVLCAGFFFCRSNVRTQNYFQRVEVADKVDQNIMNLLLQQDPETFWQIYRPTIWYKTTDNSYHKMSAWASIPLIWIRRLAPQRLYHLEQRLLSFFTKKLPLTRRFLHTYLYISPKIMKTKSSNGLTVGVIPMHLVKRIRRISSAPSLVMHCYKVK